MCESVTAATVSSLVDGNNLSWSWPLETAWCHRPRTPSELLFGSSPRSASMTKDGASKTGDYTTALQWKESGGKLDLVKWIHISVTSESNTDQQNKWNLSTFYSSALIKHGTANINFFCSSDSILIFSPSDQSQVTRHLLLDPDLSLWRQTSAKLKTMQKSYFNPQFLYKNNWHSYTKLTHSDPTRLRTVSVHDSYLMLHNFVLLRG